MGSADSFLSKFGGMETLPDTNLLSAGAPTALAAFMGTFTPLTESYWFYNHTIELRFSSDSWTYFLVDPTLGSLTAQNGITNSVKIIDRSNALIPWAALKVVEKLLRTMPAYTNENGCMLIPQMLFEEFSEIVLRAKSAPRDILEDAGNVGKMAHTWLEFYVKAIISKDTAEQARKLEKKCEDPRATNCVDHALSWMAAHNVRYTETERKVYSREHCYAGTLDGLALVDSCEDLSCCSQPFKNRLSLIDYKTSNHLHNEYLLQTAAYCKAYMEEHGVVIEDRWVLRLGKEQGDFEAWHQTNESYEEDFKAFLTCVHLTNLVDSIDERMKIQRKQTRETKKLLKAAQKELDKAAAKVKKEAEKAQKKLDRAAERERIKADAKRAREEAKLNLSARGRTTAAEGESIVCGEDVSGKSTIPSVHQSTVGLSQTVRPTAYEEVSIERRPFVIPEEG